jgi:hypothetical protein
MSAGVTNKCSRPGARGRKQVWPGFAATVRSGFQAKPHSRPSSLCSSSLSAQHVCTGISVFISRPTANIHLTASVCKAPAWFRVQSLFSGRPKVCMKTLISEIWVESPFVSLREPAFSNHHCVSKGWKTRVPKVLRNQSRRRQASAVSKDWFSAESGVFLQRNRALRRRAIQWQAPKPRVVIPFLSRPESRFRLCRLAIALWVGYSSTSKIKPSCFAASRMDFKVGSFGSRACPSLVSISNCTPIFSFFRFMRAAGPMKQRNNSP